MLPVVAGMLRRFVTGPVPARNLAAILVSYAVVVALVTPFLDQLAATSGPRSPVGVVTSVSEGLMLFVPGMLLYLAELHHKAGGSRWRIYRWAGDRPWVVLAAAVSTAFVARAIWFALAPEVTLRALVLSAVACGLILVVLVRWPTDGLEFCL